MRGWLACNSCTAVCSYEAVSFLLSEHLTITKLEYVHCANLNKGPGAVYLMMLLVTLKVAKPSRPTMNASTSPLVISWDLQKYRGGT